MSKHQRTLAAAVLLTCAASTAAIADGYEPIANGFASVPTTSWTGFYAGLNVGYAWGDFNVANPTEFDNTGVIFDYGSFGFDGDGWVGGGQIGYNLQSGKFVFGIEADVQGADIDGGKTFENFIFDVFPSNTYDTVVSADLNYYGTVRGRLGYALDSNLLMYGTGGFAWGDIDTSLNFPRVDGTPSPFRDADSETHYGYALGGGVEGMLGQNISAKFEYLYVHLDDEKHRFVTDFETYTWNQDFEMHTVRFGINYRFGPRSVAATAPLK